MRALFAITPTLMASSGAPQASEASQTSTEGLERGGRLVIRVWGKGARPFLDKLLPANVEDLIVGHAVYTAILNIRGGVEALFHLVCVDHETFLIDCAANQMQEVGLWLSRYRVGHVDVNLAPYPTCVVRVGFPSPLSPDFPDPDSSDSSDSVASVASSDSVASVASPSSPASVDIAPFKSLTVPDARHPKLPRRWYGRVEDTPVWASDPQEPSEDALMEGIVTDDAVLRGHDLPQALGLVESRGVVFNHGCFVGQEVVVRVQHRNALKQRLYPVTVDESVATEEIHRLMHRATIRRLTSEALPPPRLTTHDDQVVGSLRVLRGRYGLAMVSVAHPPASVELVDVDETQRDSQGSGRRQRIVFHVRVPHWHQATSQ